MYVVVRWDHFNPTELFESATRPHSHDIVLAEWAVRTRALCSEKVGLRSSERVVPVGTHDRDDFGVQIGARNAKDGFVFAATN